MEKWWRVVGEDEEDLFIGHELRFVFVALAFVQSAYWQARFSMESRFYDFFFEFEGEWSAVEWRECDVVLVVQLMSFRIFNQSSLFEKL